MVSSATFDEQRCDLGPVTRRTARLAKESRPTDRFELVVATGAEERPHNIDVPVGSGPVQRIGVASTPRRAAATR